MIESSECLAQALPTLSKGDTARVAKDMVAIYYPSMAWVSCPLDVTHGSPDGFFFMIGKRGTYSNSRTSSPACTRTNGHKNVDGFRDIAGDSTKNVTFCQWMVRWSERGGCPREVRRTGLSATERTAGIRYGAGGGYATTILSPETARFRVQAASMVNASF